MTMNRRRFLAISAALTCLPAATEAETWQGRAFGADISIKLHGSREITTPALAASRQLLRDIEHLFSLYDGSSFLTRLNRTKVLWHPPSYFMEVMQAADDAFRLTAGRFDPTVQTMWQAVSLGNDGAQARASHPGWDEVRFDARKITLSPGQSLTFNGIAQGFATDKVAALLQAHGLSEALVNIGEYRALGGPWRLGLSDPTHGLMGTRSLDGTAIATSSAGSLMLGRHSHIMHPVHKPQWSTVSVEARSATLADSLSTGLILTPLEEITRLRRLMPDTLLRITLVDGNGDLSTV